jgi:hypothetical protein
MNPECSTMWNVDFLNANFTSHWRTGEYRKHRIELLFDRERARLPETMVHLQIYHDVKDVCDTKIDQEIEKLNQVKNALTDYEYKKNQIQTLINAFKSFDFTKILNDKFVIGDDFQLTNEIIESDTTSKKKCATCDKHFTLLMRKGLLCKSCNKKCCMECIQRCNLARDPWTVLARTWSPSWSWSSLPYMHCPNCNSESDSFFQEPLIEDWCRYVLKPVISFANRKNQKLLPHVIDNLLSVYKYFNVTTSYHEQFFSLKQVWQLRRQEKILKRGIQSIHSMLRTVKLWIETEQHLNIGVNHPVTRETLQDIVRQGFDLDQNGFILLTMDPRNQDTKQLAERKQPTFVLACPGSDCDGLLSQRYKCNKCELYTCAKCREVKNDNHECNPDTVASINTLKKDSKPCPTCASLIYRIQGCRQMWCTQCKVGFDWHTGNLDNKDIHNPHYFEYMRQNGIPENRGNNNNVVVPNNNRGNYNVVVPDNNDCFNIHQLCQLLRRHKFDLEARLFEDFIRIKNHVQHVVITYLRYRLRLCTANQHDPNLKMRVQYILGEIDKNSFKSKLIVLENWRICYTGLIRIYEMFHTVVSSIFGQLNQKLVDNKVKSKDVQDCLTELENLCKYVNWNVFCHCKLNKISSATYVDMRTSRSMKILTKSIRFNNMEDSLITSETIVSQ